MAWEMVVREAKNMIIQDPFLEEFLQPFVLSQPSFSSAICKLLATEFASLISEEKWRRLFEGAHAEQVFDKNSLLTIETMGMLDLMAIKERDPASDGYVNPFLHFKGFKALQTYRISNVLWKLGRRDVARIIQSRCSEKYGIDIHPGATIAEGLFMDHGTGIVIGETAVIGRNCTFLHGVTLGSTGKDKGDRHPKIGDDVLIGCNTTVLGNIQIGHCCKIGSGSIVLKDLPPYSTAVGNPAKIVGRSMCKSASAGMDFALKYVVTSEGKSYESTWDDVDLKERESLGANYMI